MGGLTPIAGAMRDSSLLKNGGGVMKRLLLIVGILLLGRHSVKSCAGRRARYRRTARPVGQRIAERVDFQCLLRSDHQLQLSDDKDLHCRGTTGGCRQRYLRSVRRLQCLDAYLGDDFVDAFLSATTSSNGARRSAGRS